MIIESICNLFVNFFKLMLRPINIGKIPQDSLNEVLSTLDTIINSASSLIDLFFPYNFAKIFIGIILVIESALMIYHFVMWVIKKIPMAGIS